VYVSGISSRKVDGTLYYGTVEEEVANVLGNLMRVPEEAGTGLDKVLKVTVVLNKSADSSRMDGVYG
jgi:enamine deaminase RidA (YjgF/YER057c/UK114 family)